MKKREIITIKPVGWSKEATFEVIYSIICISKFGKLTFFFIKGDVGYGLDYCIYEERNNVIIKKGCGYITRNWFEWVTYLVSEYTNYDEYCADFIKHRGVVAE